jgi:hypothetical protein
MDKPQPMIPKAHKYASKVRNNEFFKKYNTIALLQSFAGLSLLPENHGKYVRMEELARAAIKSYSSTKEVPTADILKAFLDANYPSNPLEDPAVNLFTDVVTFIGGDYLVFPGITENGTFILSNLLAAIFHWPDSGIPKQFITNCRHAISLMLAISNTIATRLGYHRYQKGTSQDSTIEVPKKDSLKALKEAVTFTVEEMEQLCKAYSIAQEAIKEFSIHPDSADLKSPYIEESPLVYKPILYADGQYLIVSPATLTLAITDYIWTIAESFGCMGEVNEAYHGILWNNLQMQLGQMGFIREDIPDIDYDKENHKGAGFYRFDDDKIAYVQYLYDNGTHYKLSTSAGSAAFGKSEKSKKSKNEIIAQILAKPEFAEWKMLEPLGFRCLSWTCCGTLKKQALWIYGNLLLHDKSKSLTAKF